MKGYTTVGGFVKKSHKKWHWFRFKWYKPWTWIPKRVMIIDDYTLENISLVLHPIDPNCTMRHNIKEKKK